MRLLGRGGQGAVYLVKHVLNGEALGLYAIKKVAVGNSSSSLLRILREVRLLESVQHPNIILYHHAWVESSRLSSFGPPTPTLHILMAYANGGSLQSFVIQRRGGADGAEQGAGGLNKQERVRAFRMRNRGLVHLLRVEEILGLFEDVASGLGWLHGRNVLHLDLKAENVLLSWDEDALLPTAKLSDFGNATNDAWHRERTGASGTLDWTPPEAFSPDPKTGKLPSPDRSTDQWALGLILHLLSFFTLPYREEEDNEVLEKEIKAYPGFFPRDATALDHGTRHDLPASLLRLMSNLIHREPGQRINCERVLKEVRGIRSEGLEQERPEEEVDDESALVKNALVPSPSPTRLDPIALPLLTPPQLDLAKRDEHVALVQQRQGRDLAAQMRLVAGSLALVKALTITRLCGSHAPLTERALWIVLLPTMVDLIAADWRISLALAALHGLALLVGGGWASGAGVCFTG